MRVAKVEFLRGFMSTILLTTVLGLWGVLLSFFTGILWAAGGSYGKSIRRIGIPLIVTCIAILITKGSLIKYLATFFLGIGILCLGDGYGDATDEGSWLGRQVKKLGLSDEVGGQITKWVPVMLLQAAWLQILWR